MNISPHLLIDAVMLGTALTKTLVLRAKGNADKKEEKEYEKPKLFRVWNFLIYGSFLAIGAFLVYLYSAYIFINK